jgi:hypothetical protein
MRHKPKKAISIKATLFTVSPLFGRRRLLAESHRLPRRSMPLSKHWINSGNENFVLFTFYESTHRFHPLSFGSSKELSNIPKKIRRLKTQPSRAERKIALVTN